MPNIATHRLLSADGNTYARLVMGKAGSLIDAYLRSPFSGIAPWILFAVLSGPGQFEEAVGAALGLTLLTLWLGWRRGIAIHAIEVLGVVVFVILVVLGLVASPATIAFLETWAGEITNIVLALFVLATIAVRRPFTLAYAKESTPQEYWDTPLFAQVNYAISWVWAAAFTFSAVVGFIGDAVLHDSGNFWTGWVLQLAATFFAIAFTGFYPDYAGGQESRPSPIKLIDWLPTFVMVVGIYGWVSDDLPDSVGIGMTVAGIIGNALIAKFVPSDTKESAP